MAKRFPRFFFSTSKAAGSCGSVVFHMNYPRFVSNVHFDPMAGKASHKIHWIDKDAPGDAKAKATHDLHQWWEAWSEKR